VTRRVRRRRARSDATLSARRRIAWLTSMGVTVRPEDAIGEAIARLAELDAQFELVAAARQLVRDECGRMDQRRPCFRRSTSG
jgi:hypothetical protein